MADSVDVLYTAVDNSRNGTLSFLKNLESVDRAVSQAAGQDKAGGGAASVEADPGRMERLMNSLTSKFLGATGVRMGIDAVTAGFKLWQYEAGKLNDPIQTVLEKHIAVNDAVNQIARDIPFVGSSIAGMMEAFGENRHLKEILSDLREVENSIDRAKRQIESMGRETSSSWMKTLGFPESSIAESDIGAAREKRQTEIKDLEDAVLKAKESVKKQIAIEDAAARKINAINTPAMMYPGMAMPPQINPDRTESERMQREEVNRAQKVLDERLRQEVAMQQAEEMELERIRQAEAQRDREEQDKSASQTMELETKRTDQVMDNLRKIDELRARTIRDEEERNKKMINIRYEYEIQKARQAGESTEILELQRQLELQNADRPGKLHTQGLDAREVRYMSGAYGSGQSAEAQYQQDTTGLLRKQNDLLQRMTRSMERMVQVMTQGSGRGGLALSDFN